MKILVIVDLTKDFCLPDGGLSVSKGYEVVPVANKLMREGEFDLVVAINDLHPVNHKCFARNHPGHAPFSTVDLNGLTQVLWTDHNIEGTDGANFHPDLATHLIDKVLYKGTDPEVDSNSGFFDNARLKETELRKYILSEAREAGVPFADIELTIVGLATDWCIKMTALDAREIGFNTTVAIDACRPVNLSPGDEEKAIREMIAAGVTVVESRKLIPEQTREVSSRRLQALHP